MALLNILQFPDPNLNKVAKPIEKVDEEIKTLAKNMLETMYEAQGIGLAATQVNVHKQLMIIDLSSDQSNPLIFINPKITHYEGTASGKEGCLSFPGIYASIKRFTNITVEFLNLEGKKETLIADELLGIAIQHELDHLNGITIYDRLSNLKKVLFKKKLEKARKSIL